jgi:1,4-dihydroxy-2-naphthoyl-CoA hydrolase
MPRIWFGPFTTDALQEICRDTLVEHLDIRFTDFGDDWLKARMPVDRRTRQPAGILHGGASVVLAESLGSVASALCFDLAKFRAVGLEINASHLRAATGGHVEGICRPVRLGRTVHVWQIDVFDDNGRQVCTCRLTMAVLPLD